MATKIQLRTVLLFLGLILGPVSGFGHHATSEFDSDVIEEHSGEVVQVQWRNPHIRIHLLVRNADGTEKVWKMAGQDINSLGRAGVTGDLVEVGQIVRVVGSPSSRRPDAFLVSNVLLPDGREMLTRLSGQPRWTDQPLGYREGGRERPEGFVAPVEDIFRVWSQLRSNPPEFADSPPLTAAARAGFEAFDPSRDDPVLGCVSPGMPEAMTYIGPHPVGFTLLDNGDIQIRIESDDNVRVIHMNENASAENQPPSPLGYSIGRWEGDTLVATTTRINWPYFKTLRLVAVPQSPAIEITERFTLNREQGEVVYDFAANDPATFTEPVSAPRFHVWRYRPGVEVEPYECELDR